MLYSQSEIWWNTLTWNGKTVKNNQHVFQSKSGVPEVNDIVTLDWDGLPLMISAEAQANADALGNFDPQPDNAGGYVLQRPKVVGGRVMHRGARLRILSYVGLPQTRGNGLFNKDELVQDLLFALVRYEGDPAPAGKE